MHFYANSYPEIVETKLLANNSGILKPNYARLMFSHSKYYMYLGKQYVSGLISTQTWGSYMHFSSVYMHSQKKFTLL